MIAGRYTLEREIGRGGMGAVWLGVDEVLGRQVALKRIGLLPGADSTDLARAEREARLAAQLNHAHVVAIFNLVVDTDTDARWLVMEYVEGSTLAQLVRDEGPLSPDDAAPLMWQAADALVAAHAAGIVHRDVKPSNILVDRLRRVKLTDFGIARITADPALTQTGMVTGSPAYLAPEVATGERGDEAVDVWSLGATLYHVLAGRPPYDIGDQVLGGLYRIVHDEPPRLAEAGWMTPLLEGTMEKDPSRRWSMVQVRDFLAAPARRDVVPPPAVERADTLRTRPLDAPGPALAPVLEDVPAERSRTLSRPAMIGLLVGLAAVLLVGAVLLLVPRDNTPSTGAASSPSSSASTTPSSPSASPSRSPSAKAPTEQGMKAFVRRYVAAVASDPDTSWTMLTPKFQQQSGGLPKYRKFWKDVGTPHLLEVAADPESLVVSYRVRFDNFGTGKRPTVLDLVYQNGRYLIDGERT